MPEKAKPEETKQKSWMKDLVLPTSKEADIALFVEGAYPLIRGGVSTWVHLLIQAYPQYTFAVIFLGSQESDYDGIKYELPKNLVHLEIIYLFNKTIEQESSNYKKVNDQTFDEIEQLHEWFKNPKEKKFNDVFKSADFYVDPKTGVDFKQFLYCERSWDMIKDSYEKYCTDPSYLDYFWTVRSLHMPLWDLAKMVRNFIKVKALHAVSTGYAGLLASFIASRYGYPFMLTEHGIYTKERRIEMMQSKYIKIVDPLQQSMIEPSYFRQMWINFYETISKICYDMADPILSLYQGARDRQIVDGAEEDRLEIIPNGVNLPVFKKLYEARKEVMPKRIALIGRVVPIKDIKTYIRAAKLISDAVPEIEIWIVGPDDEDPRYAADCRNLVTGFSLEKKVNFVGVKKMAEVLPEVSLVVLSSISEGMPLVMLEAYAAGVPVVVTDVGACRELVEGVDEESKALGPAGTVVPIAVPHALAEAVVKYFKDEALWKAAQKSALARAEKYYDEKMMYKRYQELYEKAMK